MQADIHQKRFDDFLNCIAESINLFDRCGADMLPAEAPPVLGGFPR
jgi:hypothetical protein